MRFQTSFEKIAQTTHGQVFAMCFIGLRIILGLSSLYLITLLSGQPLGVLLILLAVATSLIIGLLVRPFALLAMAGTVIFVVASVDLSANPHVVLPVLGLLLLLGMFAAGGSGHVFGCDGIVFRNLRRSTSVTRFLFG